MAKIVGRKLKVKIGQGGWVTVDSLLNAEFLHQFSESAKLMVLGKK